MKKTAEVRGAFGRMALALACVAMLSHPVQAAEMTVSAAASLTNAFTEIKGMFRGFKFKVQHPVLGYWRLLKKLHRVS